MSMQYDTILRYLRDAVSIAFIGYCIYLFVRAGRMRPQFESSEVIYQERYASGSSQKNILTRLGGARHCLRLVVTRRFLPVTSWFPMSLITPLYDLEHVIPLDSILSVRQSRFLWGDCLVLTYRGADGEDHTLILRPGSLDDFIQSLGVKVDDDKAGQPLMADLKV